MYPTRLNRFLAMVVVYGLLLQSCRSGLHAIVEAPVLRQAHPTPDDHAPSTDQVSAPAVQSSEVPHRRLSIAGSASLPSEAPPTLQATSPTHRLAMMLDTVILDTAPSCQQVLSTDLEATDAKPAARPLVCQATRWSPAGRPASLRTRSFDVPAPVLVRRPGADTLGK
jgi:hypothetical protein